MAHAVTAEHVSKARGYTYHMTRSLPMWVDREELVSAALVGLGRAAVTYDEARCASFDAYLVMCVRHAVQDAMRQMDWVSRRQRHRIRAGEVEPPPPPVSYDAYPVGTRSVDRVPAPDDVLDAVTRAETCREVRLAVAKLPPRLRYVVEEVYLRGRTQESLAQEMGVTPTRVTQLCTRARGLLRLEITRADTVVA
jgi:RNA polymerase sigma factor for flagellar operon FliA